MRHSKIIGTLAAAGVLCAPGMNVNEPTEEKRNEMNPVELDDRELEGVSGGAVFHRSCASARAACRGAQPTGR